MSPRVALGLAAGLALASSAGAATGADIARGEQVYGRCLACHALAYDRVGPRHCGLFGRRAGSVPGFDYSPAMKRAAIVWDDKTLNLFLAKPLQLVPGSTMTYDGVPNAGERRDLIAYLKQASQGAACTDDTRQKPAR